MNRFYFVNLSHTTYSCRIITLISLNNVIKCIKYKYNKLIYMKEVIIMNNRIKELRIEKGYSQKELSSILNFTQQSISKWEKGESEPDLPTISKLANLYNVTIDYIVNGSNDNNISSTLITVYSFEDNEDNVLKYRSRRKIGSIIGLLTAILFLIVNLFVNKELSLVGVMCFISFFFAYRDSTISFNANFDVPENRYKDALMNKSSISIFSTQVIVPIIIILEFLMCLFFKTNHFPTVLLATGCIVGGILIRSYKLYSKNKVRKEQKKLSDCRDVVFHKKHNTIDVVGRGICIFLILCLSLIIFLS